MACFGPLFNLAHAYLRLAAVECKSKDKFSKVCTPILFFSCRCSSTAEPVEHSDKKCYLMRTYPSVSTISPEMFGTLFPEHKTFVCFRTKILEHESTIVIQKLFISSYHVTLNPIHQNSTLCQTSEPIYALAHRSTNSANVSSPPTFPGNTTYGTPVCLLVSSSHLHSGTPGAA
jgi:hypothetical protein